MPEPTGPVNTRETPRFAGLTTFSLLPRLTDVGHADVAVVGVPFDTAVSNRPGARFGPSAVREASRMLRTYNPALEVAPFAQLQVADAGDIAVTPYSIPEAVEAVDRGASELAEAGSRLLAIGGDHTIALPLLRSVHRRHGPVALLHFDAHLDTWGPSFGAEIHHGSPFLHAVNEGLVDTDALCHVGIRGPIRAASDLDEDRRLGFGIVTCADVMRRGVDTVVEQLRERIGERPLYVSVDIDVLDPAHAPGTGTPEAGGLTSRELLEMLRGLAGTNLVGADVVEVAPAYDHAQLTSIAASHVAYDLISLFALHADR